MKSFIFGLLLLGYFSLSFGSIPDTVLVNEQATVSILFPGTITLVDVGSSDFAFEYDGNLLLLKANIGRSQRPTTLIVRYGEGNLYTGFLKYHTKPDAFHYDFREVPRLVKDSAARLENKPIMDIKSGIATPSITATDILPEEFNLKDAKRRFILFKTINREIFTVGAIANNIEVSLENVRNGAYLTYLSLSVHNGSTIPYKVEFVGFQYREPSKKKGLADMVMELQPIIYEAATKIGPQERSTFWFAIPHFAIPKRGRLEIFLREQRGTRSISFNAPSNLVLRAKLIDDERDQNAKRNQGGTN